MCDHADGTGKKAPRKATAAFTPTSVQRDTVRLLYPDNHALRGILSFDGVKNIVMGGERPVKVSVETINEFKELAADGAYDYARRSDAIKKGDKVRITSGPFVGYEVSVDAFGEGGHGDAVVTIVIFGKPSVFNMPLAMLEKV